MVPNYQSILATSFCKYFLVEFVIVLAFFIYLMEICWISINLFCFLGEIAKTATTFITKTLQNDVEKNVIGSTLTT